MSVMLIDPRHAAAARRKAAWVRYYGEAGDGMHMPPTEFCATCWGAGRFLEPAGNGEGLVPRTCGRCGGAGLVMS